MTDSNPPLNASSPEKATDLSKAISPCDEGRNLPPSPAPSSPRNGRKYSLATELVYTPSSDQYNASSMPIYQVFMSSMIILLRKRDEFRRFLKLTIMQSATFKQTSSLEGNEYDYTRSGNPTRTHLERHLAKIVSDLEEEQGRFAETLNIDVRLESSCREFRNGRS